VNLPQAQPTTVSTPEIPVVTIFVRHSIDCDRRDNETWKKCRCPKHLRWTHSGEQYRRAAKTRSWEQAEKVKREIVDKFAATQHSGDVRVKAEYRKTIEQAAQLFVKDRDSEGVGADVIKKYERELGRLREFMERRSKFFPAEIEADDLTEFISSWTSLYESSVTRNRVLTRLRAFLRYCYQRQWTDRIPQTVAIKAEKVPTLPFAPAEYITILDTIPKVFKAEKAAKVRALVQLMRWSGLAIRDAVTLERTEIVQDAKKKNLYRIVTKRTKTGTHVSVPLPGDVAQELLGVLNGNPRYVFWSTGKGTERTATTNWSDELRKLFRAAGIPTGHPHRLRDTFAVGLLEEGVPLEDVSKALGHESIKTTERSYAPWIKARQDRLDDLIAGTWNAQRRKLRNSKNR
jgi:integrase/recombinase XerD